jgi:hypothetical protein
MIWEVVKTKEKMENEKIVENLLENALYFINQVPNHKYKCKDFHSSYDLASEIQAFLNKKV